jgi:hypothetical protein
MVQIFRYFGLKAPLLAKTLALGKYTPHLLRQRSRLLENVLYYLIFP